MITSESSAVNNIVYGFSTKEKINLFIIGQIQFFTARSQYVIFRRKFIFYQMTSYTIWSSSSYKNHFSIFHTPNMFQFAPNKEHIHLRPYISYTSLQSMQYIDGYSF